tara:strand:+ start:392 stop:1504 length:1113 start_codon:yes stop_codon:yes gene_type:complete
MAVSKTTVDVNYRSRRNHNYDLYRYIESGNLIDAKELINYIFLAGNLKKGEERSFISLVLKYYILTDSDKLENFYQENKRNLMKRDILFYCKYLYFIDCDKSIANFNYLISNYKLTGDNVQFLIDNKLDNLIKLLDGFYVSIDTPGSYFSVENLRFYKFSDEVINSTLDKLKQYINTSNLLRFCKSISKYKKKIVIDAGNLLYSVRGEITLDGYNNLINMVELLKSMNYVPIVIIHCRHLKKRFRGKEKSKDIIWCINKIKSICRKFIFETPYNKNDDFYIVYTALLFSAQIITNDNYRDHIFSFRTNSHEADENVIENYIEDLVVKYNPSLKNFGINSKTISKISKCVQVVENSVFIPGSTDFIRYDLI